MTDDDDDSALARVRATLQADPDATVIAMSRADAAALCDDLEAARDAADSANAYADREWRKAQKAWLEHAEMLGLLAAAESDAAAARARVRRGVGAHPRRPRPPRRDREGAVMDDAQLAALRDQIACHAMAAIIAKTPLMGDAMIRDDGGIALTEARARDVTGRTARGAYEYADAMLLARTVRWSHNNVDAPALLDAAKGVMRLLEGFEHDAGRGHLPSVEALRREIDRAEGRS